MGKGSLRVYGILCFIAGIVMFILPLYLRINAPSITVSQQNPQFQNDWGEHSRNLTQWFVTSNPNRVAGTDADVRAAQWIEDQFYSYGYIPHIQNFTYYWKGYQTGRNVYAISPGILYPDQYFLFIGHFDIVNTTIEGANDNGAAVAMMLTFAKYFQQYPHNYSMIFVAVDAEEVGLVGSQVFAKEISSNLTIPFGINFEMIGYSAYTNVYVDGLSLHTGQADIWTLNLAQTVGESLNHDVITGTYGSTMFDGIATMVERAGGFTFSDHGPFNHYGQNVIMLHGGDPGDPHYHRNDDVWQNISNRTLTMVGQITERIMLTVDSWTEFPAVNQDYIPGVSHNYTSTFAFIPVLVFWGLGLGCFMIQNVRTIKEPKESVKVMMKSQFPRFLVQYLYYFLPFVITMAILGILSGLGYLPPFHGYVAVNVLLSAKQYYWTINLAGFIGIITAGFLILLPKKSGIVHKFLYGNALVIQKIPSDALDPTVQQRLNLFWIQILWFVAFLLFLPQSYYAALILGLIPLIQLLFIQLVSVSKAHFRLRQIWFVFVALLPILLLIILSVVFSIIGLRYGSNLFWMVYAIGLYHFPFSTFLGLQFLYFYHPFILTALILSSKKPIK